MFDPSLAVQDAIHDQLVAADALTALVPAASIFDGPTRPEEFPSIIIGTGQTVLEPITLRRAYVRCFHDVHIWTKETGLGTVKTIAAAATQPLASKPSIDGARVVDWLISGARYMRDPDNVGHAVITVEALLQEAAA